MTVKHFRPALIVICLTATFLLPTASSASPKANWCDPIEGRLDATEIPSVISPRECDLKGLTIENGFLFLEVPPPSAAVAVNVTADSDYDGPLKLDLSTAKDGTVTVAYSTTGTLDAEAARIRRGGGVSGPCTDNFYDEQDWVESDTHLWYFEANSQPGHLTEAEAVQALRDGTTDITHQNNSCGLADQAGMTTNYGGEVNLSAQMGSNGSCASYLSRDSVNVTDFGDLPDGLVGKNCTWRAPLIGKDELQESDIRLNKDDYKWILDVGTNCDWADRKFDIESVMAHERGHTFSLDDISESQHGYLTMSAEGERCSTAPRTLGEGDVSGFRANY